MQVGAGSVMVYGVPVGDAYTVYWPRHRWRPALSVGRPLEILFGGPHRSAPSFVRAKVGPGDVLYPIRGAPADASAVPDSYTLGEGSGVPYR